MLATDPATSVRKPNSGTSRLIRASVVLLSATILGACAVPPLNHADPQFPQGSIIKLNERVMIPSGSVGNYVGPGIPETQQSYAATCRLESRVVAKAEAVFEPDSFSVEGTSYSRESLTGPVYGSVLGGFNSLGEGPGLTYFDTLIYLHSNQQPDVLRLKCRQLRDSYTYGYLNRQQIQQILGSAMTIEP